jgi:hypothetical protein
MKKAYFACTLAVMFLFAACGEFFNLSGGEGTFIYIPADSAAPASGSSFYTPGIQPPLESPRIGVYNSAGKLIREAAGAGKLEFTIPAGGPYWVDFSAAVSHPRTEDGGEATGQDNFPFVKSFGATVKIEEVRAGSSQEISLPLRVRETAIMVPYMPYEGGQGVNRNVFVPFYDLPGEFPKENPPSINKEIDEICFDFDPFGRLFAMEKTSIIPILEIIEKDVYRRDNLSSQQTKVNTLPSSTDQHGLAFSLLDGYLYYSYKSVGGSYNISKYYPYSYGSLGSPSGESNLSSAIITIDDEGILYGVAIVEKDNISGAAIAARQPGSYWEAADGASVFITSIFEKILPDLPADSISSENILDLKALNGYLYMLCRITDDVYLAAVPLEAVRTGTLGGGAWFIGALPGENQAAHDPYTLEGFWGAQKIVGWGPDRLYVYDRSNEIHRIVEVDTGNRRISRAGLVAEIPR